MFPPSIDRYNGGKISLWSTYQARREGRKGNRGRVRGQDNSMDPSTRLSFHQRHIRVRQARRGQCNDSQPPDNQSCLEVRLMTLMELMEAEKILLTLGESLGYVCTVAISLRQGCRSWYP